MRKEYQAALRELFADGLARACPQFTLVKKHSALAGFPGERAYCWRISESMFLWVVLIPDAKREAFFVELGWSKKGRFPQLSMRPSWARPPDAGSEEEYLCRLGELSRGNDFGWVVEEFRLGATKQEMMSYIAAQTQPISPEAARTRVLPRVEEALQELARHGLPFLLSRHAQPDAPVDAPQAARP
jgi:hypothetical protein